MRGRGGLRIVLKLAHTKNPHWDFARFRPADSVPCAPHPQVTFREVSDAMRASSLSRPTATPSQAAKVFPEQRAVLRLLAWHDSLMEGHRGS
jgi:hypothetical protein